MRCDLQSYKGVNAPTRKAVSEVSQDAYARYLKGEAAAVPAWMQIKEGDSEKQREKKQRALKALKKRLRCAAGAVRAVAPGCCWHLREPFGNAPACCKCSTLSSPWPHVPRSSSWRCLLALAPMSATRPNAAANKSLGLQVREERPAVDKAGQRLEVLPERQGVKEEGGSSVQCKAGQHVCSAGQPE